jgi:hypothetical protein
MKGIRERGFLLQLALFPTVRQKRKDIVSKAVQLAEKGATRDERQILLEETKQKVREVVLACRLCLIPDRRVHGGR